MLTEEHMPRRPNPKRKPADPRLIERLVKAEEIAAKKNCQARDVAEFETTMPCGMIAEFLGGGDGLISDVVVENSWKKFLRDAGDPDDPIERVLLFQLFLLHIRSVPLYAYMGGHGVAGYKAMGGLASKMTRSMLAVSSTLKAWQEKREAAGGETNARTKLDADPEAEQAELLAEHRERQRRHRRRLRAEEDAEAATELAAMSAEEWAAWAKRNHKAGADFARYLEIKAAHGVIAGLKYFDELPEDDADCKATNRLTTADFARYQQIKATLGLQAAFAYTSERLEPVVDLSSAAP
jgi:hypothetical protein